LLEPSDDRRHQHELDIAIGRDRQQAFGGAGVAFWPSTASSSRDNASEIDSASGIGVVSFADTTRSPALPDDA
jgi:hypothetical protein